MIKRQMNWINEYKPFWGKKNKAWQKGGKVTQTLYNLMFYTFMNAFTSMVSIIIEQLKRNKQEL